MEAAKEYDEFRNAASVSDIYEKVYEAEPEIVTAKKEEILLLYKQSDKYLKKNKFSIMHWSEISDLYSASYIESRLRDE